MPKIQEEKLKRYWLWGGAVVVIIVSSVFSFYNLETLPPGLDPDAAANGVLALQWLRYGNIPFWIWHASAAEPLMVWLQTVTTILMGPSVLALRSVSAAAMVVAAVTTYWLGYEVGQGKSLSNRFWAALLAGLGMASNIVISELGRTGLRATIFPAFCGLTLLFLLLALRVGQYRYYLLAGLVLGMTAYTYLAARFLPLVLALFFVLLKLLKVDPTWRNCRQGCLLMLAVAFVIILPQLLFFVKYPTAFLERARSVTIFANQVYEQEGLWQAIVNKIAGQLLMFGIRWSGQYNQSGRPLLSPLLFGGLLVAIPITLKRRREPGVLLLAITLVTMLLPDLVGGDRMLPHELRVSGCFVPTLVFSGLGLAQAVDWLAQKLSESSRTWLSASVAVLLVGWNAVDGYGFVAPRLQANNYSWYSRQEVAEAEFIASSQEPVLVPLIEYSRSIVAYLSSRHIGWVHSGLDYHNQVYQPEAEQVLWLWPENVDRGRTESGSYLNDPQALVLIDGQQALLMPPLSSIPQSIGSHCNAREIVDSLGQRVASVCKVSWASLKFQTALTWSVDQNFEAGLKLLGVSSDATMLTLNKSLGVTSFWKTAGHKAQDYRYFVHLLNDRQQAVAGEDLMPGYGIYTTDDWIVGDIIPIRQIVRLPNLQPGRYWLEVGLYDPLSGNRLPTKKGDTRVVVGPLKVPLTDTVNLSDETPISAQFSGQLALVGYRVRPAHDDVEVALRWQAISRPELDYTIFLHLENSAGEIVAQVDTQPLENTYPTTIWDPGETVLTCLRIALPPSLEGTYKLWGGWYYWQTGTRLTIVAPGREVVENRLLLDVLTFP